MLREHVMPQEIFADLARGSGGARAGLWLTNAERSKHMLLIRDVVDTTAAADHEYAAEVRRSYHKLFVMQREFPDSVGTVIRQPSVGAWALDTIRRFHRRETARAFPQEINALVAAAAIRASVPLTAVVPIVGGAVVMPSVGRALFPERCLEKSATVRVTGTGAEVIAGTSGVLIPPNPSNDADGWQGMRVLEAGSDTARLRLIIDDIDPYRFPSSAMLSGRLDPEETLHWAAMLSDAWSLLLRYHRRVAEEVMTIVTTLTPLHRTAFYTSNATSRATFGCVALSCPKDGQALALALIHEVQHAKLAALIDLVALVRPNTQELYYAPWRDDPRPAEPLLHGTYAHLGVAGFWRKQRHVDPGMRDNLLAHAEYVRWRDGAVEAANTLSQCPDLTILGHNFVEGIHETLRSWRRDRVPRAAAEVARTAAESHRSRWRQTQANQAGGGSKSKSSLLPLKAACAAGCWFPSVPA